MNQNYSFVIPAYNEEQGIAKVLEEILALAHKGNVEVVVVNDCSKDGTAAVVEKYAKTHPRVRVLSNVQNWGYGYSLKRGISVAQHEHIVILDADGSYPVSAIPLLIAEYEKGFPMVVGARHGIYYRGSFAKRVGRVFFRLLSEFATGRRIPDINSGLRVFRKDLATDFFHTLSSGFSFTTTITLAFMLNAHSVHYVPIEYHKREGVSKVHYLRDTLRSMQIIIESIVFYNPIKIFILCAVGVIVSGALGMLVALLNPIIGLILFLALAGAILILAIGFIGVFLKFTHNAPK